MIKTIYGKLTEEDTQAFRDSLKENHLYLVEVSMRSGNPPWNAVLFTGFKTGSYWKLVSSTATIDLSQGVKHWPQNGMVVIRELGTLEREG